MLKVSVPHHQKTFHLKWKLGESLKDLAEQNDDLMAEYIEGVCGGNFSCSTCHVYIDQPEFKALLKEPSESEADMLVR
jgi:ferredoxin-2, mitochondrial